MPAGDDEVLDGDEGTEDEESEDTEGTENDGDESSDDEPTAKTDKRVADLMSQRDKETARANQAEKALRKALADKGDGAGTDDPALQGVMQELREASLDALWGEYPELKKYNIDRSLIDGTTRAEMRDSASRIVKLVKGVATKSRNEALAEAGVSPEPSGNTRQPPVDYATMKDEDFEKLLNSIS